jgi:hypothetical protein
MKSSLPKSTQILLVAVFILSILTYFSINKSNKKETIDAEDAQFAVSDSGSVNKIEISSNRQKVELINSIGTWKVNNNYKADQTKLSQLFTFIYKVQPKSPVYKELVPKITRLIKSNGTVVTLYNGENVLRQYAVIPDSADLLSAFAMMNESVNPYIVEVPGSEIKLNKIFDNQPLAWKDKTVFKSLSRNIVNVKVDFLAAPTDGFEISKGLYKFEVKDMANSDSIKILSFLDLFKSVEIKEFLSGEKLYKRDSLIKLTPSFIISLQDKDDFKSNIIKIFYQPKQNGEIYGLLGKSEELVTIRPVIFEYLLQKRSFFEKK